MNCCGLASFCFEITLGSLGNRWYVMGSDIMVTVRKGFLCIISGLLCIEPDGSKHEL